MTQLERVTDRVRMAVRAYTSVNQVDEGVWLNLTDAIDGSLAGLIAEFALTELGPKPIADMPEELKDGPYEPGEARKPSRYVLLYGKGPDDIAVAFSYYNALSEREWITENGELSFTPTHYSEIIGG